MLPTINNNNLRYSSGFTIFAQAKNFYMSEIPSKKKTKSTDFENQYEEIIKKAREFNPHQEIPAPNFNTNYIFKKFSLYTDCPNIITSFDSNASL